MRIVPTKTPEQQTTMINTIRAHLAEFGIIAPVERNGVEELLYTVADERDESIPEVARACLEALGASLGRLNGSRAIATIASSLRNSLVLCIDWRRLLLVCFWRA